jgi:hypothetical protein
MCGQICPCEGTSELEWVAIVVAGFDRGCSFLPLREKKAEPLYFVSRLIVYAVRGAVSSYIHIIVIILYFGGQYQRYGCINTGGNRHDCYDRGRRRITAEES